MNRCHVEVFYWLMGIPDNESAYFDWRRDMENDEEAFLKDLVPGSRYFIIVQPFSKGGFGTRSEPFPFLMSKLYFCSTISLISFESKYYKLAAQRCNRKCGQTINMGRAGPSVCDPSWSGLFYVVFSGFCVSSFVDS